jgi:hypothetical protein
MTLSKTLADGRALLTFLPRNRGLSGLRIVNFRGSGRPNWRRGEVDAKRRSRMTLRESDSRAS